jgi:uncharacterized protein (DUF302 family)
VSALITNTSPHSVNETVRRLVEALDRRSITLFARIDHAQGARAVGLDLPDETVLLFGNPQAGTSLMQEDARVGIDLPLRMLIWDDDGVTKLGYHDPTQLGTTYDLRSTAETLHQMKQLLAQLAAEAIATDG